MFSSTVLDVGIGLIMVYLILGLMCTTVNEWVAQALSLRAKTLEQGLYRLLSDDSNAQGKTSGKVPGLVKDFLDHSLVKSLAAKDKLPSYIPSWVFSAAVTDILTKQQLPAGAVPAADPLDQVIQLIQTLPEGDAKRCLLTIAQTSDQIATFQKNVEGWFNDSMDRVSGWYKRKAQIMTVVASVGLTIFANADTVQIARKLFLNPVERQKLVAAAPKDQLSSLTPEERNMLGELTGWSSEFRVFHKMAAERDHKNADDVKKAGDDDSFPGSRLITDQSLFWSWVYAIAPPHLLGWLLTAIAASLGAPFWFDTLNKFMNIRSAGTAPNEKNSNKAKV